MTRFEIGSQSITEDPVMIKEIFDPAAGGIQRIVAALILLTMANGLAASKHHRPPIHVTPILSTPLPVNFSADGTERHAGEGTEVIRRQGEGNHELYGQVSTPQGEYVRARYRCFIACDTSVVQ